MNNIVKINDAYEDYLYFLEDQDFSDRHIETVVSRLTLFIFATEEFPSDYRDVAVRNITFRDIRGFFRLLRKEGRAEATLASHRSTQIAFWNWCIKQGYREDNPASKLRKGWSYEPVIRHAAPPNDVNLVMESLENYAAHRKHKPQDVRDALLVSFLGDNGGRLGEALDVRMSAVATALRNPIALPDGGIAHHLPGFGKTGGADMVFFERTARLATVWYKTAKQFDFAFCNLRTGNKLSYTGATKAFIRICKWVGVPTFRSQALRKRNVTDIVKVSGDWKVGQRYAGHKDIKTTMMHYNDFEREKVDLHAHRLQMERKRMYQEMQEINKLFGEK